MSSSAKENQVKSPVSHHVRLVYLKRELAHLSYVFNVKAAHGDEKQTSQKIRILKKVHTQLHQLRRLLILSLFRSKYWD